METIDRATIAASSQDVYRLASEVENWPRHLPHYRWVTRQSGAVAGDGVVEMAAWRPFGPFRWPTWWVSEMRTDPDQRRIWYRHIDGMTAGMDVEWTVGPGVNGSTEVTIVHRWPGPAWPLIGGAAADRVIGPVFIHGIASRTLAGIGRVAESLRTADAA